MEPVPRRTVGANELATRGTLVAPPGTDSSVRGDARNSRPVAASDFSSSTPNGCQVEKVQPIARKRRGGSRRACNECKQQKVSLDLKALTSLLLNSRTTPRFQTLAKMATLSIDSSVVT